MLNHFNFNIKRDVTIITIGEVCVSNTNVISTILGSCISVVLYDELKKLIGVNHYVLVSVNALDDTKRQGRYGVHAIPMLVEEMLRQGAEKNRLQAKLLGGSDFIQSKTMRVGSENAQFAIQEMNKYKIPIIAKDFNQSHSRKIFAYPDDFKIRVEYPTGVKFF